MVNHIKRLQQRLAIIIIYFINDEMMMVVMMINIYKSVSQGQLAETSVARALDYGVLRALK